jgi:hypothetical protein
MSHGTSLGTLMSMRINQTSKARNALFCGIALGAMAALAIPANAEEWHRLQVNQEAWNNSNVTVGGASVKVWGVTGPGASASIGATGALASVSESSIADHGYAGSFLASTDIRQSSINTAYVTNQGNTISVGAVTGKGASVGISAAGAVSSVSASSIGSAVGASFGRGSKITQTSYNGSLVSTGGAVSVRVLSGAGASVGISAVGATSVVSFSRIR